MFSLVHKDSGYGDNFALTPKDTNNNGDTMHTCKLWLFYYDKTRYLQQPFHHNYLHRTNSTRSEIHWKYFPRGEICLHRVRRSFITSHGMLVWSWNFRKLKAFAAIILNWPYDVILVSHKLT